MAEQIQQALATLNGLLTAQGITPYKIGVANPHDLRLLDKNARFMTKETFDSLTAGVKQMGLSSLPFCYFDGTHYHVLSGNHRVKAAREAKKDEILFLYTDEKMSRQEQITVQLAHNQIAGQDDPQILKELWDELESLDLKFLTGFDDDFFEKLQPVEFAPIKEAALRYKMVNIIFLQEDLDKLDEAAELIDDNTGKDGTRLARFRDFNLFFDAVLQTKEDLEIVNTATAVRKMAEITIAHLAELREQAEAEDKS